MKSDKTETAGKIKEYLEKRLPYYMEVLCKMVGINSFTENPPGVNSLGDYTASVFKELRFTSESVKSVNPLYGKHLILSRNENNKHTIGCISHLDTVFPLEEERRNNFAWRVMGNLIYGPGTNDIKGGTVVIYMILDALSHLAPELFDSINWLLLFNASEETDSRHFGEICIGRLGNDTVACLVFEAGRMEGKISYLVTSRKGRALFKIRTVGKGGHSGVNHREGASAVVQLADVTQKIYGLTDYSQDLTYNIGRVSGGLQYNRVPDSAEADVEMRAFAPEIFESGISRIMKLNGFSSVTSADGDFSCKTEIELIRSVSPWPENNRTLDLMKYWQRAAEILGMAIVPEKKGGLSDGNLIWDRIPTIDGLGPSGGNAHCSEISSDGKKDQEYALQSSFVPKALLSVMAILKIIEDR